MNTITQRLREIADTTEQYSDRHSRWVAQNLRAIAAELEAPAADAVPVAMDANEWAELYRLREAVKGPAGYETWQDAATAERRQRVLVERDHLATVAALQARIKELESSRGLGSEMPAYGNMPWDSLIEAVCEAQTGNPKVGWERDQSYYIGHQPVSVNMNSLNRIVSKFVASAQARINALEARQVPAADKEIANFLGKVRATCEASLSVPAGTAVDIDPAVVAEMHKFMRDEPSMFDRLALQEFMSLSAYIENNTQPDTSKEQP